MAAGAEGEAVKVVPLNPMPTMKDALETVDMLRAAVERGEVRAFFAVGVRVDDSLVGYTGSSSPITRLRMIGAIAQAHHDWLEGKVGNT